MTDWTWADPIEAGELIAKVNACERLVALVERFPQASEIPPDVEVATAVELQPAGIPQEALAAFEEFGRTTKTFRASLHLASLGYGPQSLMLSTVIYESAMTVLWACEHPELANHYSSLHARWLLELYSKATEPIIPGGASRDVQSTDLTEEERSAAKGLFGPEGARLWTGHASIDELVRELQTTADDETQSVQLQRLLEVGYRWASYMTVPTGVATQSHREQVERFRHLGVAFSQIGPSTSYVANALHLASRSFLAAASTLAETYLPALLPEFEQATGLLFVLWKNPDELRQLEDNDPCPCELPERPWGECHKWTLRLLDREYDPLSDDDIGVNVFMSEPTWEALPDAGEAGTPVQATPDGGDLRPSETEPKGPVVFTFTATLPFSLGIPEQNSLTVQVTDRYAEPDDIAYFGSQPWVRFRVANLPTGGLDLWPTNGPEVLRRLYGKAPDYGPLPKYDPDNHYEQWIALETPSGRLQNELTDDRAYAFHRCFQALNGYLLAMSLVLKNSPIHTIATQDLGNVLFRGYYDRSNNWRHIGPLMMHPERWPITLEPTGVESRQSIVQSMIRDINYGRPFVATAIWHARAIRTERLRGDHAATIIYLQTAAETMIFDLWRSLLVDRGKTSAEIRRRTEKSSFFTTVLQSEIPKLLGGSWDTTLATKPVGAYWAKVYEVRNRIVHSGLDVGAKQSGEALVGFLGLRDYVTARLWARHSDYPRTLLAKVGENGLARRGWDSSATRAVWQEFRASMIPFYWPDDQRKRREMKA